MVRAPAAKAGGPGLDSRWLSWILFLLAAGSLINVDGMKDLWYSIASTGNSATVNTDMNGKIYKINIMVL